MGNVVELEGSGRSRRRRRRPSKTALVLGGGGFTGGVYEIGALRALDLLAVDRTVNQFDVYVGTSAGALIAALAANGVTPERIVLGGPDRDDVPISAAVRASTALPMVYQPTKLKDRELVDGGIVSTTNLDIAVERGRS
jgi:predicted acylesterase/phospholipase RssA